MKKFKKGDVVKIKEKYIENLNATLKEPLRQPKTVNDIFEGRKFTRVWLDDVGGMSFRPEQLEHHAVISSGST